MHPAQVAELIRAALPAAEVVVESADQTHFNARVVCASFEGLRSLANAAQMIERNPHLMQLRLLQVLGERSGNTVVLGMPGGAAIPIRGPEVSSALPDVTESGDA